MAGRNNNKSGWWQPRTLAGTVRTVTSQVDDNQGQWQVGTVTSQVDDNQGHWQVGTVTSQANETPGGTEK